MNAYCIAHRSRACLLLGVLVLAVLIGLPVQSTHASLFVARRYTAVLRPSTEPEIQLYDASYEQFRARYDELWPQNWRLHILQTYVTLFQEVRYNAVWRPSAEPEWQLYGATYEQFRARYDELWPQNWGLHILQTYVTLFQEVRYNAVWRPSAAPEWQLYGATYKQFPARYDEL